MTISAPPLAEVLNLMNVLGKVRFLPIVSGQNVKYVVEWQDVMSLSVNKALVPKLDIEVSPSTSGFLPEERESPADALDAFWDNIRSSSTCPGGRVLVAKDRCWVLSMNCEWIDVSMHVLPKNIREELLVPPEILLMEWDDDLDDDEDYEEKAVSPPVHFVVRGTGLDDEGEPQVQ